MPTYEYECERCGHKFELFQSMTAPPRKRCPKCRGKVRRLLGTGAGLIFKGSGFYATDYRSDSYKKSAKADKERPKTSSDKSSSDKKSKKSSEKSAKGKKSTTAASSGE